MDNRTIEQIRDNETKLIKELHQKENIIKEIREYIEKAKTKGIVLWSKDLNKLLEILDKGE